MKSKRLQAIASLIDSKDAFIDIGCDHAYLCIYMAKQGCTHILATDIHEGALEIAKKNICKEHLSSIIKTKLSDGLLSLDTSFYNTLVIAGMGTSTIEHILSNKEQLVSIDKIILQSNRELPRLRKFMRNLGYFLVEEKIVNERNHYYTIMLYQKGQQHLSPIELEFGIFKKEYRDYYFSLRDSFQMLLSKVKKGSFEEKELLRKLDLLQSYLQL